MDRARSPAAPDRIAGRREIAPRHQRDRCKREHPDRQRRRIERRDQNLAAADDGPHHQKNRERHKVHRQNKARRPASEVQESEDDLGDAEDGKHRARVSTEERRGSKGCELAAFREEQLGHETLVHPDQGKRPSGGPVNDQSFA